MNEKIFVTKPFMPPQEEYIELISNLWESKHITNNGTYALQLEKELENYLDVQSLSFVSNGTIALQVAMRALNITGEVITTPFSFAATTNSIIWNNSRPVFVDIDPRTLCINANEIEQAITGDTEAILATHVYGIPCDVEKIERIAKKYNLKVIYDAAHAFGVKYKDKSLLNYGDLATLSLHATKIFHTVEGGAIINNGNDKVEKQIHLHRNFGLDGEEILVPGINAKNSEFHAAMGLCNLKYIDENIELRKEIAELYDVNLPESVDRPFISEDVVYNYAYYPIIFKTEEELLKVKERMESKDIYPRRYFYPSLNEVNYLEEKVSCRVSENISRRILCLPVFEDLEKKDVLKILHILKSSVN